VERGDLFMKVNCVIGGRTATPARFPRPATPVEDMACINKRKKDAASLSLNEMTQETFKVAVELALERLRTACGLEEMGVHTWRERVVRAFKPPSGLSSRLESTPVCWLQPNHCFRLARALPARVQTTSMPGIGIPVVGDVLMMDAAPGLSLNLLLNDRASDLAFIQTMLSRIDPQEVRPTHWGKRRVLAEASSRLVPQHRQWPGSLVPLPGTHLFAQASSDGCAPHTALGTRLGDR